MQRYYSSKQQMLTRRMQMSFLVKGLSVHAKVLLMPHLQAVGKAYRI